jgi:hypothetical protein
MMPGTDEWYAAIWTTASAAVIAAKSARCQARAVRSGCNPRFQVPGFIEQLDERDESGAQDEQDQHQPRTGDLSRERSVEPQSALQRTSVAQAAAAPAAHAVAATTAVSVGEPARSSSAAVRSSVTMHVATASAPCPPYSSGTCTA